MLEKREPYQEGSIWFFAPNKGAPIAFAILFAVSGIVHGYQTYKYRSWKVSGLLPWSALLFTIGFILRTIGAFGEWDNVPVYIASTVFLLAGPPVYEGANFLILGRILYYIPYMSPIHPGRVFSTFIGLLFFVEVLTANGAALVANTEATQGRRDIGEALLKTALILQLVLMAGFVSLAATFHTKCCRAGVFNKKLKHVLTVLYISCVLIVTRTIYRTKEYFSVAGAHNWDDPVDVDPLIRYEWYFWFFEVVVMYCNTTMLNIFHPMRFLPRSNKIYLAKDGVTEIEGPGFDDPRPWFVTFIDPFDIVGLIFRKGKEDKYWETGNSGEGTELKNDKGTTRPACHV
ncbi:putative RTA1 domain protein [Aspergillus lucknowensis]|uniref:RTA1 domain protein n=1 Tax=Aspergillus lucknowensis TaxID=176173 RepID=A0ABR4LGT2_9EURO